MVSMPVELYTDGSSLNNPGPSGLGFIIRYWDDNDGKDVPVAKEIEGKQGFRLSTNSRMEISAGIYGINEIMKKIADKTLEGATIISVASDSSYFCDAINKHWIDKWQQNNWLKFNQAPVKNKDLWEQVIDIINKLKGMGIALTITHVDGHSGHEFNERADKLAVSASNDSANHIVDTEYEKANQNKRTNFGSNTYKQYR